MCEWICPGIDLKSMLETKLKALLFHHDLIVHACVLDEETCLTVGKKCHFPLGSLQIKKPTIATATHSMNAKAFSTKRDD